MYVLHNLHVHSFVFHLFIFCLNSNSVFDSLISVGTSSYVLGPMCLIVSVPYFTVLTLWVSQDPLFLKSC